MVSRVKLSLRVSVRFRIAILALFVASTRWMSSRVAIRIGEWVVGRGCCVFLFCKYVLALIVYLDCSGVADFTFVFREYVVCLGG